MVVEKEFNITPFRLFLGKVIPNNQTEWFFIENYSLNNLSNVLTKYFYIIKKEYYIEPNYEQLFNMLTIFKAALLKKIPKRYSVLLDIKVLKREQRDNKEILIVQYIFEN